MTTVLSSTTETGDGAAGRRTYKQYIGGEWVPAESGETFDVLEPFTRGVFGSAPAGSRADAKRAIEAAAAAQPAWAATPPAARAALFTKAAEILERRTEEFLEPLASESGSAPGMTRFQTWWSAILLRHAAAWVYESKGEILQSDYPTTRASKERRPLGVVASFGPWNGSQVLGWRAVVLPLAAGNTVVLKPSEEAPVTGGVLIAEVLEEAGFPAGTINVVTHPASAAAEIAEEFYENPDVRLVYFTGSAATARHVASRAAATLTPVVLELGGYNHLAVLEDADLDYAVRVAAFSAFMHAGQSCMCTRKILVARPVYDEFVERFVKWTSAIPTGSPADPNTIVGPLINEKALENAQRRITDAVQAGANVLYGGNSDGLVLQPTILANVPDTVEAYREETFAPVVIVQPVDDDDEIVRLANDNDYGLSFSVITPDYSRGEEIARQVDTGAVHVNTPTIEDEAHAPNGGMKNSGWGRSGIDAISDFTELRWLTVETAQRPI